MSKQQHILILGFVFPEPASSAAGNRMMQLISLFREKDWKITFASPAADSEYAFDLATIGVDQKNILLNDASFDIFIKELDPDIVLFDRFMMEEQFGWRVAENCPGALRVLDTEDLHCLRMARQAAWKEKREFEKKDLFSDLAKREIASILRCDLTLMISEFEIKLLQDEFRIDPALLHYMPIFSGFTKADSSWKSFGERKNFIFIGNFLHEPNWNAVQFLKESIWTTIRKALPEAELHIYGAYPSQKVFNLNKPEHGFLVKGRAEDAKEVVGNARVSLAPLRFGAGIKGKLLEAMECGTPSVTTEIGAESMFGELPWNGFIVNEAEAFTSAAIDLYSNEKIWKQSQENGIKILEKRHDQMFFELPFFERLNDLKENVENHRIQNFMGAMLMHHTLSSTKYMSRWIELKNK